MGMDSVYKLSVVLGLTDNMTGNLSSVTNKVADSTEKLNKAFGSVQKAGAVMVGVGTALTTACLGTVQSTFDTQNALGELASLGVQDVEGFQLTADSHRKSQVGDAFFGIFLCRSRSAFGIGISTLFAATAAT